jgi:hypothetical protein
MKLSPTSGQRSKFSRISFPLSLLNGQTSATSSALRTRNCSRRSRDFRPKKPSSRPTRSSLKISLNWLKSLKMQRILLSRRIKIGKLRRRRSNNKLPFRRRFQCETRSNCSSFEKKKPHSTARFKASWLPVATCNLISISSTKSSKNSRNYFIMLNIRSNSWRERLLEPRVRELSNRRKICRRISRKPQKRI